MAGLRVTSRVRFLAPALLMTLAVAASGQSPWIRPRAGLLHWKWTENEQGVKLVDESGGLPSVGFAVGIPLGASNLELRLAADVFAGDVEYDGYLVSPDGGRTPHSSRTEYIGAFGEALICAGLSQVSPAVVLVGAGLEASAWRRSLGKSFGGDMDQYGYDEYWSLLAVQGTAELGLPMSSNAEGRVSGSIILPVATDETVDLSNVGGPDEVKLEPDAQVGWRLKTSMRLEAFEVGIEYQRREFDRSPLTYVGDEPVCQPESELETLYLYAGLRF